MTSDKQRRANQQNAQLSTGPTSREGQAISAQNALVHGLCSQKRVLPWESQAEYDRFEADMLSQLLPLGPMETLLADRVIFETWRLQRAAVYEASVIGTVTEVKALLDALVVISRYETRITGSMMRSWRELDALQRRRQAKDQPLHLVLPNDPADNPPDADDPEDVADDYQPVQLPENGVDIPLSCLDRVVWQAPAPRTGDSRVFRHPAPPRPLPSGELTCLGLVPFANLLGLPPTPPHTRRGTTWRDASGEPKNPSLNLFIRSMWRPNGFVQHRLAFQPLLARSVPIA